MRRTNTFLVAIIVFLTIVITGLIILLVITLTNIKEKPFEKEDSVDRIVNGNVLSLLDKAVSISGDPYYNMLESNNKSDEEIFNMVIGYLYANDMYTKREDEYTFKQKDVINIAKKYLMRDNFNYITQNQLFRYDSSNKTFTSKLEFGVLGLRAYLLKSSDIYEKTETSATVIFEIEGSYVDTSERINGKYNIVIDTQNYKIISITKIT